MTLDEFKKHLHILEDERFEIEPMPSNIDRGSRLFKFDNYDDTHVKITNQAGELLYLSLSAIELINPGNPPVIVTRRQMRISNQSFV
jgi:hypothetical protein